MCHCDSNPIDVTCKCCTLLRGPKKFIMQTKTTGCRLNFEIDYVPQFEPVKIEDGERTVEIYECHNVPGYKSVYITIISQKE